MRTSSIRKMLVSVLCVFALVAICPFVARSVFADEEAEDDRELPKSGRLSSTLRAGDEGLAVDGPWGQKDTDIFSEDKSPITGSVRQKGKEWEMFVQNNSEDKYSVQLQVVQYNKQNKVIKRNNFSLVLQGGQQETRAVNSSPSAVQMALDLKRWKNLSPKKKESSGEVDSASNPGEFGNLAEGTRRQRGVPQ